MARYTIYVFKYPTYAGVKNASQGLQALIASHLTPSHPKFAAVSHSMGGLVMRQFLLDNGPGSVDQVISLATPHLGTPLADASASALTSGDVQDCYERHRADLGPTNLLLSWESFYNGVRVVSVLSRLFGIAANSQGVRDLSQQSTLATAPADQGTALFVTLAGTTTINAVDHGSRLTNSTETAAGCYFEDVLHVSDHDELVALNSAQPSWSTSKGPGVYHRDHFQMEGDGTVQDDLQATIINYLLFGHFGAPRLTVISGGNQVGPANQLLPQPIVLQARTAEGAILSNAAIQVTVASGGGSVDKSLLTSDGGGQVQLRWTLGPAGGVQRLDATIGGFAASVVPVFAVTTGGNTCPKLTPYALGAVVNASLVIGDCLVVRPPDPATYFYKGYTASVGTNQAVRLTMNSSAFSPRIDVNIEPSANWSFGLGPPGLGVGVNYKAILPPGPFLIRATSIDPSQTGSFTFTVSLAPVSVSACEDVIITSGASTTQTLSLGDCVTGGSLYDRFIIGGPPGWTIFAVMTSSSIDSYLELYNGSSLVASDDDGAGGLDSRLVYNSPTNTSYTLRAASFGGNALGSYTLAVTLVPPPSGTIAATLGVSTRRNPGVPDGPLVGLRP